MEDKERLGKGFCGISISESKDPLLIYRVGPDGRPVLKEDEIIILKINRIWEEDNIKRTSLILNGDSYVFLRNELLSREYDPNKCKLSEEEWDCLKDIVQRKIKYLEDKSRIK